MKIQNKGEKMNKHIFIHLISITVLFCFLSGFQRQERLPPSERHEVEVRLVLVDVIVTKDGRFVADLIGEDFELFEDGKKVPINSCELISFGERRMEAYEAEPDEVHVNIPKKQLVVVFDGVSTWQRNLKDGSRKIIDELLSLVTQGHEIMVIQLNERTGMKIIQPFTEDANLIRKAVVRASGMIWYDDSLDALKMWEDLGIEDVGPMAGAERYIERLQPVLEQEYFYREKERFEKALGGIFSVVSMVKDFPGRKSILIISDGFPDLSSGERRIKAGEVCVFDPLNILDMKKNMTAEDVIRELIRFANAQNISLYTLDPDTFTKHFFTATAAYGPMKERASPFASDRNVIRDTHPISYREGEKIARIQSLRWISEDTGAISLRGAKKYEKFKKVMTTDLNYYYQLSYYPPRKKPDGKYHKIKAKVKRGGVDVRYRKGYTDYSEEEEEKMLLVSVFYNPSLFKEVPFEAGFIPFRKGLMKIQPWINVALPVKELLIEGSPVYGQKVFNLNVWIKDKERGDRAFGMPIPIVISSALMERMKSLDYLVYNFPGPEIEFSQKEYQVIFALCDDQTDEVGTWETSFSLEDQGEGKEGTIINYALGLMRSNPSGKKKTFSLSKKDGTLEYEEYKFFPSVTNRFPRTENAAVFLQVFRPQGKMKTIPKFSIMVRNGIKQPIPCELVAESWDEKSKTWNGLVNLDLSMLFPGDYALKVHLPVSEETVLSNEVKLVKLEY